MPAPVPPSADDHGVVPPSLVGRRSELDQLLALLALVEGGRGQVAVVRGVAGIGKTRLLAEVVERARSYGATVRLAEAAELDQARPFGAVSDALGVVVTAAEARFAGQAHDPGGDPRGSGLLEETPVEVNFLVEHLVGRFESLCHLGPLVLVVENLHWVDGSTLAVLRRLVQLCAQYPVLVLLSTRPTERPEVEHLVGAAARAGGVQVELGPLSFEAVCSMAAEMAGGRPGPRLVVQLEQTSGNPLFVVELVSAMVQRGLVTLTPTVQAEVDETVTPAGLTATILHRLGLLPAETVELLRTAAILGQNVDVGELALLTHRRALELAGPLRAATRAGVLAAKGEQLVFCHELVHAALYEQCPPTLRKALHTELAGQLAANHAPAYQVAHHLAAGAEVGDTEAIGWLHRAGLDVAPRSPPAGVQVLQRAVELAAPADPAREVMRMDLAVALGWAGRVADAEAEAQAVISGTSNHDLRGRAAWWLASSLLNRGRAREARDRCSEALRAGVGSERVRVLLRLTEAIAGVPLGGRTRAVAQMEELLAEARRLGDPAVTCRCLVGLEMAESNEGRLEQAAVYGAEAVRQAERLAPAEMVVAPAHLCYAWVLEEQDRLDEALGTVERLGELAGPLPRSSSAALNESLAGRVHFQAGRWDTALLDLDSALAWDPVGAGSWTDALAFRAAIAVHRGDLARAGEDLDRIDAELGSGGTCWALDHFLLARAFFLEATGQSGRAAEVLRFAWQLADTVPLTLAEVTVGPHLARWSRTVGDLETAGDVAEALAGLAGANPHVPRLAAAACWCRGIGEADPEILLEAVELERRGPRPLELGLVCEDAAAALAVAGHVERSRELLREALGHYDALLASQRVASARARLRALGVRTGARGRRSRPASGWEALTEAELRVVELVAEHLSNPEIAGRLVVSRRTVETHVSHALAKLGCVSRRELVAEVGRRAGPDG